MEDELIIEKPLLSKVVDTVKTKYRFVVLSLLILTFLTDQTSSQGLALAMIGGMAKTNCTNPLDKGEFCWSESTKAVLLGCYFYGYCLQVIPTTIAKKLGINWAFRIIAVVSGIIQLTFATTVQYSVTLAIILQTVRGFGASIFMSGLMEFATIWCIGNESKAFISFVGKFKIIEKLTLSH
ncbi:uncharacterized protein LOC134818699 [Bolinopsis microptera]|uniref:uncharacterized protein LOC134818699 n=1 Tax=Bolinopsis microptera TaxID=2820187 RepID=UPI003079A50C